MYCKYLSKSLNGCLRCKLFKTIIYISECRKCLKFEPRVNKPIKKVSNKREFVKKEIYEQIYKRDKGRCRLEDANCIGKLDLHHIVYRSEDKNLINEPTNCIMLCKYHHDLAHSNKKKYQPILLKMLENK